MSNSNKSKIRVSILVEVDLDASEDTVEHFYATGESMGAMRLSIERAEARVQSTLDKYAKKLNAVAGADHGSLTLTLSKV